MLFAGRGRLMREVESLLEQAAAGRGELLVPVGVPGAGKTAVLDAAGDLARARRFAVLRASAAPGQPGRLVWAQLLRQAGAPDKAAAGLLADADPLTLDAAARELTSGGRRLVLVDDLDRAGGGCRAAAGAGWRVAGATALVIATAGRSLGVRRERRLGPLTEDELAALVGPVPGETRHALWVASGCLPGSARSLAAELASLPEGRDPLVHLALHAPSHAWFLDVECHPGQAL